MSERKLGLIDRLPPPWQDRILRLVRWHNDSLFAALTWAVPLAVVWWIVVGFFDFTTSIFAEPIRRHVLEQGWWEFPTQVIYFLAMYATALGLGLLTRWGFGRVIDGVERYIINQVPGLSYIWSVLRDGVLSLKKALEPGATNSVGSYQYVGGVRFGGVIKILPITSIGEYTCTLWDPSAPAPTNGEVLTAETGAVIILPGSVPSDIIAMICSTGLGLSRWGDVFLQLEASGGHTLADMIAYGHITPHVSDACTTTSAS